MHCGGAGAPPEAAAVGRSHQRAGPGGAGRGDWTCCWTLPGTKNHSILISSHIVSDLEKLCDTIAFLHKGRLLLCEEKDALREEYALWHGTAAQLAALDVRVYGKRVTPYGAEALVRRDAMPAGAELAPVSIEELFVLMVKGENVQNERLAAKGCLSDMALCQRWSLWPAVVMMGAGVVYHHEWGQFLYCICGLFDGHDAHDPAGL